MNPLLPGEEMQQQKRTRVDLCLTFKEVDEHISNIQVVFVLFVKTYK